MSAFGPVVHPPLTATTKLKATPSIYFLQPTTTFNLQISQTIMSPPRTIFVINQQDGSYESPPTPIIQERGHDFRPANTTRPRLVTSQSRSNSRLNSPNHHATARGSQRSLLSSVGMVNPSQVPTTRPLDDEDHLPMASPRTHRRAKLLFIGSENMF